MSLLAARLERFVRRHGHGPEGDASGFMRCGLVEHGPARDRGLDRYLRRLDALAPVRLQQARVGRFSRESECCYLRIWKRRAGFRA